MAGGLGEIQNAYPELDIGSYPQYARGQFRVSLVMRGTDAFELDACVEDVVALVSRLGGEPMVLGDEEEEKPFDEG